MHITITSQTSVRHPEAKQAIFPGVAKLDDGSLFMIFVAGSDFESSDQRLVKARSTDNGRTWSIEGYLYDTNRLGFSEPFTDCAKPTALGNGRLIAAGYGFLRDRPDMGLSDYAEKYGRFPKNLNIVLTSDDNGKSWNGPEFIKHEYAGLELSGPVLKCASGRLAFFAAPFVLNADKFEGFSYASDDGGRTWSKIGTFFSSTDVTPWEVRSIQLPSGIIVLVIWAYDLKNQRHLSNHVVWSDDDGKTWSKPIDTGLRGQASNLFIYKGQLGVLQARREGPKPGICLSLIDLKDDSVTVLDVAYAWDAVGMAIKQGNIETQFAALKFGQPSLVQIDESNYVLFFWNCIDGTYSVQSWGLTIGD